jgi:hypothetical protein
VASPVAGSTEVEVQPEMALPLSVKSTIPPVGAGEMVAVETVAV